jgi:hypothetical protein
MPFWDVTPRATGRNIAEDGIHYFSAASTHLYYRLSKPQGLICPEGLGKLIKVFYPIGSWTRDLSGCSETPSPLRYRVPHVVDIYPFSVSVQSLV